MLKKKQELKFTAAETLHFILNLPHLYLTLAAASESRPNNVLRNFAN